MQQTLSHKPCKIVGIFLLAAFFLSVLASLSLPSLLEFKNTSQEQLLLNLSEKDMKEVYDSSGPENETLEKIDFYQEHLLPKLMLHRNSSERLFTFFTTPLSTADSDIQRPPPQYTIA